MKFQGCVNFDVKFQTSTTNNYNEIPKSVYEKLSHFHMLKATCETTFTTYKIFFIEAPTKECATMMLGKKFNQFYKENNFKPFNVVYSIKEDAIMDTTNGHDAKLVEYINYIWCRQSESFKPILFALFTRDKDEANEKGIELSMFENDFESFAYEFLQHVCDDVDLGAIIDFIRYREDVPNSICNRQRRLYSNGWVE